jgi:hypothetical protein
LQGIPSAIESLSGFFSHNHLIKKGDNFLKVSKTWRHFKVYFLLGLSAANPRAASVGAVRSTPQPPHKPSSFAWQIIYGGFAGYLLPSPSHSSVESLWSIYPHNH